MRRVVILTNTNPFDIDASHYAQDAMSDCLRRGEAPLSACRLTMEEPESLDAATIMTSLDVAQAWLKCADSLVVFVDQGVSAHMRYYIEIARRWCMKVEFRSLPRWVRDTNCLPA